MQPAPAPTESTRPRPAPAEAAGVRGWVLYDGACGFCSAWVPRLGPILEKRGFASVPLQEPWVSERVQLSEEELMRDLQLLLPDGALRSGSDAYRYVMRRIWWAWPLWLVSLLPGARWLFDRSYRAFADRRYRISAACSIEPPSTFGRDATGS